MNKRFGLKMIVFVLSAGVFAFASLLSCSGGGKRGNSLPAATVTTPTGVQSGTLSIQFFLIDRQSDPIDIVPEFSVDGGATYSPADVGIFVTTGLASSPGGVAHNLPWDSVADGVGLSAPITSVRIRISPFQATIPGAAGETLDFTVDNIASNGRPTALITTPSCEISGNAFPFDFTLIDPESDPLDITVDFSIDSGISYATATVTGTPVSGLPSTPAGTLHSLDWDTVTDGVGLGASISTVRLRVTPADFPPAFVGTAGQTADFTVDNVPRFLFAHHLDPTQRNVSVFRVDPCAGALTEIPNSPFPLTVTGSPFGTWDLLFNGGRLILPFWKTAGALGVFDVDPGSGDLTPVPSSPTILPTTMQYCRTVAMANGRLFVVNMMSKDISVLDYNAGNGALTLTTNSPFSTLAGQPIRIEYGGGRIFCTNTLPDGGNPRSIAVMDVDPPTGDLTHVTGSPFPFSAPKFILYVGGRLIATRDSPVTEISVMDVNPATGALTAVSGSPFPASGLGAEEVAFRNDRLYVTHTNSNEVGVFDLDPTTGAISEISGSPFAAGSGPWGIAMMRGRLFVANRFDDTIGVYDIDPATGAITQVPGSPFPSGGLDTSVLEVTG